MTKKKINLVLIAVVVLLWGAVGYNYFKSYFILDSRVLPESHEFYSSLNFEQVRDTFSLNIITRDPFLGKVVNKNNDHNNHVIHRVAKHIITPVIQENQIMSPPDIIYFGYIKSGNKELALLKVDGNILRLRKGETKRNITVKSFSQKDLSVNYDGQNFSYIKQ